MNYDLDNKENVLSTKKSYVWLIVIIIVVVSLIIAGLCYYFFVMVPKNEENISDQGNNGVQEELTDVKVLDAVSLKEDFSVKADGVHFYQDADIHIDIKVPKIESNKSEAIALNKSIMDEYENQVMNSASEGYEFKRNLIIKYDYVIKNNIVYINVFGNVAHIGAGGHVYETNYFYDIKNDKILSMEEAYSTLGFDYSSCNGVNCGCIIRINNGELVSETLECYA